MISDFYKQKNQREAEEAAQNLISILWETEDIQDVSDDKTYQAIDVDFIAEKILCEVKNDELIHRTHNIFAETLKIYHDKEEQGWLNMTQADYIFYRCANTKNFIIFWAKDLRDYLHQQNKYLNKILEDKNHATNKTIKQVWGKLVNVYEFAEKYALWAFSPDGEDITLEDYFNS